MNLQNGYKVIYEKAADGKRTFYASKTGLCNPEIDTKLGDTLVDADFAGKFIYEYKGKFYVAEGKTPTYDENGEPTDNCLTVFDEVFIEAAPAVAASAPTPVVLAHADAIVANSDTYGKITKKDDKVTIKVTGTVNQLKNPLGVYGNWVGFKINVPEDVDAATAIYTRPNGTSCKLSEVLDTGKNYANVYSDMSKATDKIATYYLDWNGDGINDLSITIDASKATLAIEELSNEADAE